MADGWWGLGGVVVGASITWIKDLVIDARCQRRNARYLAIRAVCLLDRYLDGCVAVVGDDGTVQGRPANPDGTCEVQVATPLFPIEALDGDWKAIPQQLMYALLSLPNVIEEAHQRIGAEFENAFPPDYGEGFEERQFQYATLGLQVAKLAKELRHTYDIPPRAIGDWNPVDYLREQLGRIEARREQARARSDSLGDL